MATDDSFKPLWVGSAVTEQVGGFQIPGVCLQAFPFLLSPTPSFFFLLSPQLSRG